MQSAAQDAKIVNAFTGGRPNCTPCRSSTTGLVYLGVSTRRPFTPVTSDFKINLHDQITGADRSTLAVRDQWLKMVSTGRSWPGIQMAQKEVWHADLPDPKSGGTLTTAATSFFKGARTEPSSVIARPMANSCGSSTPGSASRRRL